MRAFGIDPGSRYTGWAVVEADGSRVRMVDCGVIAAGERSPLEARLETIFADLDRLLARHAPDAGYLESIFHHKSARSALVLGHARGVALLALGRAGLPVREISPAEVKKAVTGRGRADKAQVQSMVRVLLGLPEVAQADASDALAVAFAGVARGRLEARLGRAERPRAGGPCSGSPRTGSPRTEVDPAESGRTGSGLGASSARGSRVAEARAAWIAARGSKR